MKPARRMVSASAILLVLTISACTSESAEETAEPRESSSDPSVQGPGLLHLSDAELSRAPDSVLQVVGRKRAKVAESTEMLPYSLTPDGLIVAGIKRRDPQNPLRLVRNDLALVHPRSGQVNYLSTRAQSEGVQVTAAATTRRWVTWITTPSTSMASNPWTLYSYDRKNDTVRKLADAPTFPNGNAPMTSDFSYPSIVAGRVYLTGASSDQSGGTAATSVYSAALDGRGELREDFRREEHPIAAGKTIVTVPTTDEKSAQIVMHYANRPGKSEVIAEGRIEDVAHSTNGTAWTQKQRGKHVVMLKTETGDARAVFEARRAVKDLLLTEKYIQFEIGNAVYWYDLDSESLSELDERGVYLPPNGHGNYVVWKTDSPHLIKPGGKIVVARLDPE
ncbi:hypothetical protein MU582_18655 [Nocardioidaceae bacterium SCSIO 66511]|nr:hypothetical protein MU582_18655 [Nocardioidaceae bacterium SCSIO 66511]